MKPYLELLERVLDNGQRRETRNGVTYSVFGESFSTSALERGYFPLITTRKMSPRGVLGELAAFLWGAEELQTFKDFGCPFWDYNASQWASNAGKPEKDWKVGRIYGVQWRDWNGVHDQLTALVDGIRSDPMGRRHLLTAWNPSELGEMCLPPCHILAQFYVRDDALDIIVYMRSVDVCLGLPSDIVLYAALLILVAKTVALDPGRVTFFFGDTHVYEAHANDAAVQLNRAPHALPTYILDSQASLFNFHPEHITFEDYSHDDKINYILL